MRSGSFAAAFAAAFVVAFSLGAKGCSNCEKARAEAELTCQTQGEESAACKLARLDAAKACTATPTPPPSTPQPIPDPQCSVTGASHSCWHWPPDSTMPLYACPVYDVNGGVVGVLNVTGGPAQCPAKPVPPPVTCAEACPAGTHCEGTTCVKDPTPPPTGDKNCDGEPISNAGNRPTTHASEVDASMARLTGCSIGSECLLGNKQLQVWAREVINDLRAHGVCAGQHEPGVTDEIAVASTPQDTVREAYKVGAGDDSSGPVPPGGVRRTVVWSRGGVREAWNFEPRTEPIPPPGSACTAPITPKVDKFALKAHQRVNDSTPQFYNGETHYWNGGTVTGYCDSIGFVDRLHCPARMECGETPNPSAVKCNERVACERIGVSGEVTGKPLWRTDGILHLTDNIFQASCSQCTWIEICAADATACQRCQIDQNTGLCVVQ